MKTKNESKNIIYRILNKFFPYQYISPRWDHLLNGKFGFNYFLFFNQCIKNNKLNKKDFRRIIFVSSARGGSHLFSSLFHNIEECFCFDEAFTNLDLPINFT